MKIDLHMHSAYSDDGEFTPSQLVAKCQEAGITCMAISDHNCVKAVKEGRAAAGKAGIACIPATEIDCMWREKTLHVLAYGIDEDDPFYAGLEENESEQNRAASLERLARIRRMGFDVQRESLEKLAAGYYRPWVWTGEMFGEVILQMDAYKDDPRLKPFREGGPLSDNPYVNFYWEFCSEGKPCFVPVFYPPMDDILQTLHAKGALAVLAHPGANFRGDEKQIVTLLQEMPVDGVEVMSSYHTQEQTDYFYRTVKDFGKHITCGSDFHGKTKPAIRPGGIRIPTGTGEAQMEAEVLSTIREWNGSAQ